MKKGKEAKAAKDKDDQEWEAAGEGARSKAQLKKDEQVVLQLYLLSRQKMVPAGA